MPNEIIIKDSITGYPAGVTGDKLKVVTTETSDSISSSGADVTPKFVAVNLSASGDLISAVTGKKIRVLHGLIMGAGDVTVKFQSGGSTDLTGALPLADNVGFQIPYSPVGNFQTATSEKLNLVLSGSVDVDGWLVYVEV